jgi:ubiquinone/menaquinone biosynthesis C-methylase UbiE
MAYKFFSPHNPSEHASLQWLGRDFATESESTENRTILKAFATLPPQSPPLRVLEAGCGLGGWVQYFKTQGHDVIGVECVDSVIQKAKEANPSIPVIKGDITALEFQDNSFDVYVSLGVLEHFEDGPGRALKEAHRVLRPNGTAFIAIPLLTPLRRYISHPMRDVHFALQALRGREKYFWEYRYTSEEMEAFLEASNFEVNDKYIDDYAEDEKERCLGLWADFFFLRSSDEVWKLNSMGRLLLKTLQSVLSPWSYCSGIMFSARAIK